MKEIFLTQNKIALVDDEDFDYLNQFNWYAGKRGNIYYAFRSAGHNGNKILMHRELLKITDKKKQVDHINHNGLDNRKENLRLATNTQNHQNVRKRKTKTSSIYKGVYWAKDKKRWAAQITVNGKKRLIGRYKTELEAAIAYNTEALMYFGEFSNINKIP